MSNTSSFWSSNWPTHRRSAIPFSIFFGNKRRSWTNRTHWAEQLNAELEAARQRIVALQYELDAVASGYETKVNELETENRAKTEWALAPRRASMQELEARGRELVECVRLLETAEATVEERTLWAQRAEAQREEFEVQLSLICV